MKNDLFSWLSTIWLALFLLPATLAASAPDRPSTDAEKIADALRAGPRFITKDATLLDWPTSPDGEYRVLHIDRVGISYMYAGAWVPDKSAEDHGSTSSEFHVGPHIMIVSPHRNQQEMRVLSHDGSNGMPYVTHLPNGIDLFLVIPVRQWDEETQR
jgi:hypothetical protein